MRTAAASARSDGGPLERLARRAAAAVRGRIPDADLDERDPEFIRRALPALQLLSSRWFRGEVRGLENIPAEGAVLLVGNHSGGNVSPDSLVFASAFSTYFGAERPFHQLAHDLVLSMPGSGLLRRSGTLVASPHNAARALSSGAALLVYPGGDREAHRPTWEANTIDFDGRRGFVRLALEHDVPIVPVVSIGGQETALFLGQGRAISKRLGLENLTRVKVFPMQVAPPFGLTLLDLPLRVPLPAKITVDVLPPIDLKQRFGADAEPEEIYDEVTGEMQDALSDLADERSVPVVG